ncbi:hypothetical protein ACFLZM_06070 [Thermodesulfobacteriota bacterium]
MSRIQWDKEFEKIFIEKLKRLDDMSDVLTPESPPWEWFIKQLGGNDGISFGPSKIDHYSTLCRCKGYPVAEGILEKMTSFPERDSSFNINVQKTLEWFYLQDWACDCEVFYNWIFRWSIFEKNNSDSVA